MRLRLLSAATLVSAYLLVVLGDTVRVTDSGMGCSSWPLCNGTAGLSGTYHAMLEQSHRYLAAIVTVLVAASFAAAWRWAREDRLVFVGASAALGLIGMQVVLGAVTVFAHNAGWTVALHLACAWLVVGAVTATAIGAFRSPRDVRLARATRPSLRAAPAGTLGLAAAVAFYAVSVSGMLVLHEDAAAACPGWPTCGRGVPSSGPAGLQYVHRTLVLVAALLLVMAAVRAWDCATSWTGRMLAAAAVTLLAATAALGGIVATTGATATGQDLHLAIASALWICVVALATPLMQAAKRQPDG
jgi:heme A synthase